MKRDTLERIIAHSLQMGFELSGEGRNNDHRPPTNVLWRDYFNPLAKRILATVSDEQLTKSVDTDLMAADLIADFSTYLDTIKASPLDRVERSFVDWFRRKFDPSSSATVHTPVSETTAETQSAPSSAANGEGAPSSEDEFPFPNPLGIYGRALRTISNGPPEPMSGTQVTEWAKDVADKAIHAWKLHANSLYGKFIKGNDDEPERQNKYYVHYNGAAWFVKGATFFEQQGGLREAWGKAWSPVWADSIEHARCMAELDAYKARFGTKL